MATRGLVKINAKHYRYSSRVETFDIRKSFRGWTVRDSSGQDYIAPQRSLDDCVSRLIHITGRD